MEPRPCLYGLLAEFAEEDRLLGAARALRRAGYRRLRAYTPYPVEGLPEALGLGASCLPYLVFAGMGGSALFFFAMQSYSAVFAYPLNVGGRPLFSWPAFLPVTLEMTLLFGAITALVGMLLLNRLPQPYHPVFNVPEFELASQGRYFLCVRTDDPKFHLERTRALLEEIGAKQVSEVPC